MSRRNYGASRPSIDFALKRGWAYSRQEFNDFLDDVYDGFSRNLRPAVFVIQPRNTCQVEWSTNSMVPEGQPVPKVSAKVMERLDAIAKELQKRSRSRNKERPISPTGGTYHGLREADAKFLATHLAKVLADPATYNDGKVVPLFTQEDNIA